MRLIDCLENWDALVARVPLGQWRMAPDTDGQCSHRNCAYVGGKACTHRDIDQVDDGVVFKKALTYTSNDPHAVVALKADIERQLRRLPRLPLALFRLMYLDDHLSMDAARQVLRISSLRDVANCHNYWIREMELPLADWFPAVRRRMAA
jgi:hypothetical protein